MSESLASPPAVRRRALAAGAAILLATLAYGAFRLCAPVDERAPLRIALVQGNVPNAWRNDPTRAADGLRAFADLTRTALAADPDLVGTRSASCSPRTAASARRSRT